LFQVLDKAPRHDRRHHFPGVARSLSAVESKSEREGVGEVVGGSWGQGRVGHCATIAARLEQDKNIT
jgi:hypothetical protein